MHRAATVPALLLSTFRRFDVSTFRRFGVSAFRRFGVCLLAAIFGSAGCKSPLGLGPPVPIRYAGSSTVAIFLRDAEPVYRRAKFDIDTQPESEGGERAILEGATDLAGVANNPRAQTLRAGIAATLIGRDAIAVIVNTRNPLRNLSRSDLRNVFTGKVRNWSELDGPDLPILPFIVGPQSATRKTFRDAVLDQEEYGGCRQIQPDRDIIKAVAAAPGGIGQISFSFLNSAEGIRPIAVEGEEPSVTNFRYPIARPLYLLWREGNRDVEAFVKWTQSGHGQRIVMQHFVGVRVVGSVRGVPEEGVSTGTLIAYTETYPVYDGGIYYYPHRPYEILSRHGVRIRRVTNHRGTNDESPMRIDLPPGTYLVRVETSRADRPEFFVTIEAGKTTELDVEDLLRKRR